MPSVGRKRLRSGTLTPYAPMQLFNLHTHNRDLHPEHIAIHNVYPEQLSGNQELPTPFSCGIHPWFINPEHLPLQLECLHTHLPDLACVAIGESGLDKLCTVPMEQQTEVFRKMVDLSEQGEKPLIIHCVKAWPELLAIHREVHPRQPWIIHGFRGNPALARQLIRNGFYLSFGKLFNPESVQSLPTGSFFLETDDKEFDISTLYQQIARLRNCTPEQLAAQITQQANMMFGPNLLKNMFKK